MRHRPGVTLLEVLMSIFIMGIGMLALLTLFPLGAVNMGQALRDDRVAAAAANANGVAFALDIRHNNNYSRTPGDPNDLFTTYAGTSITAGYTGPSFPLYVDFYGYQLQSASGVTPAVAPFTAGTLTTLGVRRVTPLPTPLPAGYASAGQFGARWFTLPDDITFGTNAVPQADAVTNGVNLIDRGGRYTWAYLLRRPQWNVPQIVDMSIVVYAGRSTQSLSGETPYQVVSGTGVLGTNSVTLTWAPATQQKPAIRRGGWVLDVTPDPALGGGVAAGSGYFYRVVNITDMGNDALGNGQVSLELQTNLRNNAAVMAVMEDVAEVIDKGTGWQP